MNFLHHLLVPSHRNNYRARALHLDFLTYYLLAAIFLGFLHRAIPASDIGARILGIATDVSISKLVECTNQYRAEHGLSSLAVSEKLADAARRKADDMLKKNYWAHNSPSGQTPWSFVLAANYSYSFAGENLAKNFMFSNDICHAWMSSPSHRENILRPMYSEVGFAVVNGTLLGDKTTLVVQMFGAPQSSKRVSAVARAEERPAQPTPIIATPTPKAAVIAESEDTGSSLILANKETTTQQQSSSKINLNVLTYDTGLIFMIFLIITIISDLYFAHKLQIIRVSGKHIAHFAFVVFMFVGLFILARGVITAQAAFSGF